MNEVEHLDAVIIGAGISGISAAYHLQKYCHTKRYKVLERRQNLGGTWDLFNYPGVRSDSDMYTFGFSFKHWADDSAIAEKSKIIDYLKETVEEFGIDKRVNYSVNIIEADWDSRLSSWNLLAEDGQRYCCQYLFICSGYYDYDQAHNAELPGIDQFEGDVIHPQFWPKDFDYTGKRIVVIGSGATAVTLVPSMADKASHVTMLQRSPTYMGSKPAIDPIANRLAAWFGRWAARWWFVLSTMWIFIACKLFPERAKQVMRSDIEALLGDKFNARDFTPTYNPWDQRVCLCPDGDFFEAIKQDQASVVTDTIKVIDSSGIQLDSGQRLDADVVVTATGLKIQLFGGIKVSVDGNSFNAAEAYVYKGMMLSGVPNAFLATGYTNASWTLKVDLTHRYATRLINHAQKHEFTKITPCVDGPMRDTPLLDLSSGYIKRAENLLPKQASRKPWKLNQNYLLDTVALKFAAVSNPELKFS